MDTAEKICILKPVMRPQILDKMMEEILRQCERVLTQTLNAFFPNKQEPKKVPRPEVDKKPAKPVPDWLQKWAGGNSDDEEDNASRPSELDATPLDLTQHDGIVDEAAAPVRIVKRRLKRAISDFDENTNTHLERNHQRTCLALTYIHPIKHITYNLLFRKKE